MNHNDPGVTPLLFHEVMHALSFGRIASSIYSLFSSSICSSTLFPTFSDLFYVSTMDEPEDSIDLFLKLLVGLELYKFLFVLLCRDSCEVENWPVHLRKLSRSCRL